MTSSQVCTAWTFGPYCLDHQGHLRMGPTAIHLPPLQRRMLLALVRQGGHVLSRETLLREVWGHSEVSEVSISRTVHGLRRAFMDGPLGSSVIRTIYGGGYRLEVPIQAMEEPPSSPRPLGSAKFPSALTLSTFVEGLVWLRKRDPRLLARAERHFRHCLLPAPDFTPAMVQLAHTRLAQHRWGLLRAEEVEHDLERLLRLADDSNDLVGEVLALRVEALSLLHWQPDLVEARFGSWLAEQLPEGPPLHSWVRHLLATGRANEALRLLEPHLTPDNPDGWTLAATAWWMRDKHDKAIGHLRRQLSIDGGFVGTRLLLALVLADRGRPADALRELEDATITADPEDGLRPFTILILALCGNRARAASGLRRGLSEGAQDGGPLTVWGLAALALGEEAAAEQLLERAVHHRCGLAPFARQLPLLRRLGDSPALERFQAAMAARFRCGD